MELVCANGAVFPDSRGRLSLPGMCDNRGHSFWGSFGENRRTDHGIYPYPVGEAFLSPAHHHLAPTPPSSHKPRNSAVLGRGAPWCSRLHPLEPTTPRRRDHEIVCRGDPMWSPAHDQSALASPYRTTHGICTNNVRMQTKRLLLGMEKLSALLTDEVVHEHTVLASLRA